MCVVDDVTPATRLYVQVDAPPIQMSSQLEALYQYIKEQDDEEAEPYGGAWLGW
jgi:hypothetical protein